MAAKPRPTNGELEILRILWRRGPSELTEIREELRQQRDVATTTIATMLRVMQEKGLIDRRGQRRSYRWFARVNERATKKRLLSRLLDAAFGGSKTGLFAHLVESGELTREDWKQIDALLRERDEDSDEDSRTSDSEGDGS